MKRILCYGDSITWGADPDGGPRFDAATRYPRALAARLGSGYEVIEEGFPGRTTVYETFVDPYVNGKTYLYPCLISHMPLDLVVLMLGTNDLSMGVNVNAYYAAAGAERLIRVIRQACQDWQLPCPKILLLSPPLIAEQTDNPVIQNVFPQPNAHLQSTLFKKHYSDVAASAHCAFLAAEDYAVAGADGVHITARSHLSLAEAIAAEIKKQLEH